MTLQQLITNALTIKRVDGYRINDGSLVFIDAEYVVLAIIPLDYVKEEHSPELYINRKHLDESDVKELTAYINVYTNTPLAARLGASEKQQKQERSNSVIWFRDFVTSYIPDDDGTDLSGNPIVVNIADSTYQFSLDWCLQNKNDLELFVSSDIYNSVVKKIFLRNEHIEVVLEPIGNYCVPDDDNEEEEEYDDD